MNPRQFGTRCKAALEADPIMDLVKELVARGITEERLGELLETQSLLPGPFKVALQNKYRDFRLTNP
ncbi:MAG: hypothetical protein ACYSW8_30825 [Planctomycetota bacterium]|jgi:hypothetical protein